MTKSALFYNLMILIARERKYYTRGYYRVRLAVSISNWTVTRNCHSLYHLSTFTNI